MFRSYRTPLWRNSDSHGTFSASCSAVPQSFQNECGALVRVVFLLKQKSFFNKLFSRAIGKMSAA
jgi:hypothetical protein